MVAKVALTLRKISEMLVVVRDAVRLTAGNEHEPPIRRKIAFFAFALLPFHHSHLFRFFPQHARG